MEREHCDDSQIPLIPTIPIEEAELDTSSSAPVDCKMNLQPPLDPSTNLTSSSQCNDQSVNDKSLVEMLHGLEEGDLEVAAAAAATVAAVMESKEQIDTQLLIKFLTDPEMVKKLTNENGLNQSFTLPCSKAEPSVNNSEGLKLKPICTSKPASLSLMPNGPPVNFSQPLDQARPLVSRPRPLNQSFTPTCSKVKASVNNSEGLKSKPIYIHPIGVAKQVSPLTPSTSRPDVDQMSTRISNKYREPYLTRVNPVAPINLSSPKPNIEAIKKLINEYGRPNKGGMNEYGVVREHAWGKPLLEQNPLLLASTPLKTVRPNAFSSNYISTSNFHFPSFSNVNICPRPPPVGLNYYKSPIFGQTGNYLQGLELAHNKTSIEVKPKYHKPCMYFNSTRGCRNGSNCSFLHDMSKQQRTGVLLETPPVTKRMKFLN